MSTAVQSLRPLVKANPDNVQVGKTYIVKNTCDGWQGRGQNLSVVHLAPGDMVTLTELKKGRNLVHGVFKTSGVEKQLEILLDGRLLLEEIS